MVYFSLVKFEKKNVANIKPSRIKMASPVWLLVTILAVLTVYVEANMWNWLVYKLPIQLVCKLTIWPDLKLLKSTQCKKLAPNALWFTN